MLEKRPCNFVEILNSIVLPIKIVIPQPIINSIPYLTTNEDIRIQKALNWMHGYVLDIGCGANKLIKEYRQKGGRGLGVDVYDWGGQDLIVENTGKLPFEKATFDTATMIACINHIPNRGEVMLEVYRILKPDGHLILTNLSPALSAIWHKYAFWDKDQHQRGMKEGEVFGLKEDELEDLGAKNGFIIEKRRSFSWNLNTIYLYRKR